jgi:hypothetical protein
MQKLRTPTVGFGFTLILASIPALITFTLFYGLLLSGSPMIQMTSAAIVAAISIRELVRLVNRRGDLRRERPPAVVQRVVRWAIRRHKSACIVSSGPNQTRPRD